MKNILVLAAFISPSKGSEYSVAWNYVKHMSKYNNLTVVYGASGDILGDCFEMEDYAIKHPIPHVQFVAVHANKTTNALNILNRKGIFRYSFYVAFNSWQRQAYRVAKELIKKQQFDLCHTVGPIGYREPGYFWKLRLPYIWGPIGGSNNSPWVLIKHLSWKGRIKDIFRSFANTLQMYTVCRVKKALQATDVLLTATTENQINFFRRYCVESIYMPENCIDGDICVNNNKYICQDIFNFIVIGRQDERKNTLLFLQSLSLLKNKDLIHVDIVGDGSALYKLKTFVATNGLDRIVSFKGQLPRYKAIRLFNNAHMHVITSICEGNPTTIWEAMMYGVPTLSLDHCGMHDTINKECGILIPIHNYNQCVNDIAHTIDDLLTHPQQFKKLSDGVVTNAQKYLWSIREKQLLLLYDMAIEKHKNRNKFY